MLVNRALMIISLFLVQAQAWAQGEAPVAPEVPVTPIVVEEQPVVPKPAPKKTKGRRIREKETEGTEALGRFEADIVIESQYQLNGQPLEVDPD